MPDANGAAAPPPRPALKAWTDIITGPNNQTVAIGRVLGLIVFAVFVLTLPAIAIGVYFCQKVMPDAWVDLFREL